MRMCDSLARSLDSFHLASVALAFALVLTGCNKENFAADQAAAASPPFAADSGNGEYRANSGGSSFKPSTNSRRYYADQCVGMRNDGLHDDEAPLEHCMASMPRGAAMNLDGNKSYLFIRYTRNTPWAATTKCGIYLGSNQSLYLNGATINTSQSFRSANAFPICAGGPMSSNTPESTYGAAGNFIQINDVITVPTRTVTVSASASAPNNGGKASCSGVACANQFKAGDYVYMDCGTNTPQDYDIFVGWNQVQRANASTGVITMVYPVMKNYAAANCASGNPRVFDITTSRASSAGGLGGPLAQNIAIEGPGTIISPSQSPITLQGTVNYDVGHIVVPSLPGNGFLFANQNHFGRVHDNIMTGPGCGGDTDLNGGEFTSSYNLIDHNTVTATGVGCTSRSHIFAEGDSEGDEFNTYRDNIIKILPGGSVGAAAGYCDYTTNTWGDKFEGTHCNSADGGFTDPVYANGGPAPGAGPVQLIGGVYTVYGNDNAAISLNAAGDELINTNINYMGNSADVAIAADSKIIGGYQSCNQRICQDEIGHNGGGWGSTIAGVTFKQSGNCNCAIQVDDPGSVRSEKTRITGNNATAGIISWAGSSRAHLPNAVVESNTPSGR